MKKFLAATITFLCLTANSALAQLDAPSPDQTLQDNKIYFFIHSLCQSCRPAYSYLFQNHPELDISLINMKFKHNLELYKECVAKFEIKNSELRLPLICMGNNYIMGWDNDGAIKFEQALLQFRTEVH